LRTDGHGLVPGDDGPGIPMGADHGRDASSGSASSNGPVPEVQDATTVFVTAKNLASMPVPIGSRFHLRSQCSGLARRTSDLAPLTAFVAISKGFSACRLCAIGSEGGSAQVQAVQ
jgi:hypothetical protein